MYETIDGMIYKVTVGDVVKKEIVGPPNVTNIIRVNDQKVADVSYEFNYDQGDYVETARVERDEPLPLSELDVLKNQVNELTAMLGDIILNGGV